MKKGHNIILVGEVLLIFILFFMLGVKYKEYAISWQLKETVKGYNRDQKKCNLVGGTVNYIIITRKDKNDKAVEGSKWVLKNVNTGRAYEFQTKQDGKGGLVGLENGEYYLNEVEVPKGLKREKRTCKIIFDQENKTYTVYITEQKEKSILTLHIFDKNHNPVSGLTYHLYDESKKEIASAVSDQDGTIEFSDLLLGSIYYVGLDGKEEKTKVYLKEEQGEQIEIIYEKEAG